MKILAFVTDPVSIRRYRLFYLQAAAIRKHELETIAAWIDAHDEKEKEFITLKRRYLRDEYRRVRTYAWFLSQWAKLLSWSDTARMFNTSWAKVCNSVEMAVDWGRARLTLSNITAIGVDEIKWHIGHKYLTEVFIKCL
ncbi:MAG: hypothetical protein GY854_28290 [Deltaproteobacteria bacterium]|nr:hypothetical protein [Deltaproteobacteria bacterium]